MREKRHLSNLIAQLEFEIEALRSRQDEANEKKWRLKRAELAKLQYQLFEKLEKEDPFNAAQLLWESAQTRHALAFTRIFDRKFTASQTPCTESIWSLDEQTLFVKGLQALSGVGMANNYHIAFQYFEASAKKAHAGSQYFLGWMYFNAYGVLQNRALALHWYRLAAKQGNAFAQNDLGFMRKFGLGVYQDYTLSLYWFNLAASQGNVIAQYHLGFHYKNGEGVAQNFEQAIYWLTLSAEQGNVLAQVKLGSIYSDRYANAGVLKANHLAIYWFRLAYQEGYQPAQRELEWMYHNEQVQIHSDEVIEYRRDAEQGLNAAHAVLRRRGKAGDLNAWYHHLMVQGKFEALMKFLSNYPNDFFEALILDPMLEEKNRLDWISLLLAAENEGNGKLNEENLASCKMQLAISQYTLLGHVAQKYNTNEDKIKFCVDVVNIKETRELTQIKGNPRKAKNESLTHIKGNRSNWRLPRWIRMRNELTWRLSVSAIGRASAAKNQKF